MRKIYKNVAVRQAAYRERDRESEVLRQLAERLKVATAAADELGALQGTNYVVAAIQVPRGLAESIRAREKDHGIAAAVQLGTFVAAGAEVIHRAIDKAVARGTVSDDDQAELVDRLAGEVAKFAHDVEVRDVEGTRN